MGVRISPNPQTQKTTELEGGQVGNLGEVATGHRRVGGDVTREATCGLKIIFLSGKLDILDF